VSVTDRDTPALGASARLGSDALTGFAAALREASLDVHCRAADASDVVDSTWAKRLGIPRQRPAWLVVARKP